MLQYSTVHLLLAEMDNCDLIVEIDQNVIHKIKEIQSTVNMHLIVMCT